MNNIAREPVSSWKGLYDSFQAGKNSKSLVAKPRRYVGENLDKRINQHFLSEPVRDRLREAGLSEFYW
jgi:hypothetical protein